MSGRPHHRPMTPGDSFFFGQQGGPDPVEAADAAHRAAQLLVRGARDSADSEVAERLVHLAETEGLETLAELWSGAPADSLAGCLWRLYLLRSWVYADPVGASREFDAGTARADVARVVSGVAEPPGPRELQTMVDEVLRGVVHADFADVLFRASAFARVVAAGRAGLAEVGEQESRGASAEEGARMLLLSDQLAEAGRLEMAHSLS